MGKMITGGEVYEAIRETCQRLYIAAGGDKSAIWTVQPFPETACIAASRNGKYWKLGMPAIPATATLTVREADMFVAFGVHEILHALWTDFDVVTQASGEGLHSLVNALEDCRIEMKAKRSLPAVAEAATLLELLTNHVVTKASEKAPYRLDDARNFAFTLGNIIFVDKLKYRLVDFPRDWRAEIPPHWLPVVDTALARFGSLRSTSDVLILARELSALAQSLAQPPQQQQPSEGENEGEGAGEGGKPKQGDKPKAAQSATHDASSAFPDKPDDKASDEKKAAGKAPKAADDEGDSNSEGDNEGDSDSEGEGQSEGQSEGDSEGAGEGEDAGEGEGEGEGEGDSDSEGEGDSDSEGADEGQSEAENGRGGAQGGKGEGHAPPLELSDYEQNAPDNAKLGDVADNASKRDGTTGAQAENFNQHAEAFFGAVNGYRETMPIGDALQIEMTRGALATPAKLRRDVMMAVRSPERVGRDRRQASGRMDMRLAAQMRAGALNVFSRRHDESGVQAAVSLLVDLSGSMRGPQALAAAALALHLGDALKTAGVKFEIAGYYQMSPREDGAGRARLGFCKELNQGWTPEARGKTAALALAPQGGTATMPAAKEMAQRLLGERNATRRILLVLTDGMDCYPPEAMKACREFYAKLGVEIIGLAIMIDRRDYNTRQLLKAAFGESLVFANDLAQIASVGLHELVTVLNASDRAAQRGKAA